MSETKNGSTMQVYRVFIKAAPQKIWDAITRPEWIEKYGYQARAEYDLRAGGSYAAYASEPMKQYGAPSVIITGKVIESDPPRKLVQTWHPVWDPQSAAEPETTLTWEIREEQGGYCRLTISHDVAGAPHIGRLVAGEDDQAGGGWAWILSDLKTLLETGKAIAAAA